MGAATLVIELAEEEDSERKLVAVEASAVKAIPMHSPGVHVTKLP